MVNTNLNSNWSQVQEHRELKLYHNPASSLLNVELDYTGTREVPDKLIIRNSLGQAVMVIPVRGNRDFKTIDVREWTSGLYFYSLMGKDQTLESGKFEILK
jgi:hypothetical protein